MEGNNGKILGWSGLGSNPGHPGCVSRGQQPHLGSLVSMFETVSGGSQRAQRLANSRCSINASLKRLGELHLTVSLVGNSWAEKSSRGRRSDGGTGIRRGLRGPSPRGKFWPPPRNLHSYFLTLSLCMATWWGSHCPLGLLWGHQGPICMACDSPSLPRNTRGQR